MLATLALLAQTLVPIVEEATATSYDTAPHLPQGPLAVEAWTNDLLRVHLPLDGESVEFLLQRTQVRAPGYMLLVDVGEGRLQSAPTSDAAAYVGLSADGRYRARVGFNGVQLLASVRDLVDADRFDVRSSAGTAWQTMVLRTAAPTAPSGALAPTTLPATTAATTSGSPLTIVEYAADFDFEAFLAAGSDLAAAELRVITVLTEMNDEHWNDPLETDDPEITNRLTALVVRTNSADPYSSVQAATRLEMMRSTWNNSLGFIPRDTAQLFTGANLFGGTFSTGFTDGLCTGLGYTLIEQSLPTLQAQAGRQTYMLGVQWGLTACNTEPDCNLMCSGFLGSCGDDTGFGSTSLAELELAKQAKAACLDIEAQGPARSVPSIATVQPATLEAVNVGDAELLLSGSGFLGTTSVTIGGIELDALTGGISVLDDQTLRLAVGEQPLLGATTIEVQNSLGTGSATLNIVPNAAPTVDLVDSEPQVLSPLDTAQVYVGAGLGDTVYLFASTSAAPSILPGIASLDLGNNFTQLIQLGIYTVSASTGYVDFTAPLTNLPPGIEFFVQAATISAAAPALPAPVTNLATGVVF